MAEKRTTYKIQDLGGIGEVHIADEVVAIVAGLAATDVDGVASMAGNITNELVSKLGKKNLSKGVRVPILEGVVTVDLSLNIEYGRNILETSKKVQEKVKSAIENMTGLEVADVNIKVEESRWRVRNKSEQERNQPTWLEKNFASTFSRCCFR